MAKKDLKLNIGCGTDIRSGWVNLDIDERVKPDVIHDLHSPLPFPDASVSEINAQDILEHFTSEDVEKVISELSRVLVVGGKLRVRTPNVDSIFESFVDNPETRNLFLYGDTSVTGIWGAHKVGYTRISLLTKMKKYGLSMSQLVNIETNFDGIFIKSDSKISLKKITFVNQTLDVGGAEVFNTDLLTALKNDKIAITAYVTEPRFAKMLESKNIPTTVIPVILDVVGDWKGLLKAVFYMPKGLLYYWQVVKNNRDSDLFLVSGFSEKILVSPLAKFYKIPVVWIEFGPISPLLKKFFGLPKFIYRMVKDIPQRVIVPSQHTKNDVVPHGRIPLERIFVIPCGRDISSKELAELKKTEVIPKSVVCVSRLEPGKGQDLLITAFAEVIKKVPGASLYLSGDSSWKKELEALVKKLSLESKVTFVGRVADSLKLLQQGQVCVFPSVWQLEGFGLVTIEAMALGKPIVAFKVGPTPEMVFDGWNGFLAESGDASELAEKIIYVLEHSAEAKKVGIQAQSDFKKLFDIEIVAKKYKDVLISAVSQNKVEKKL